MPATERAVELLIAAAEAAHDKKAENVLAFDVSEQLAITDAFLVASASNDRQVKAIVDAIEERLRTLDAKPVRREGEREGRWVLLDYLEIVVHVQHDEERSFYSLERLWRDCPIIPLPAADGTMPAPAAPATPAASESAADASAADAESSPAQPSASAE
ncbi:ribosome silencing factor [Kribbella sp. NBC_01245]|uniref:ribosome silencing factor n=1 Tax=Kribbella sp. NBC_01245 TaxID=2903578 RepID=UPI002E2A4E6E|nr:ribosome silencing factor [Kribbella sp. NBC_01245]